VARTRIRGRGTTGRGSVERGMKDWLMFQWGIP
jgi:hypothetical protein